MRLYTTTATFLLFSLHHHHHHISIISPSSSSFLLFSYRFLISILFPRKAKEAKIRPSHLSLAFKAFRGKPIEMKRRLRRRRENNKNEEEEEGETIEMWWWWWWWWWRWENNRNVAVVVYSFTIYEAVLKKKLSVGSMWGRCRVDVRSM